MLGGCIRSIYSLEADVYLKVRVPDGKTGQIKDQWKLWKTVGCNITPFVSTSFKAQGTSEMFGEEYDKLSYLTMKTSVDLGRNARVTNIRNKYNQQVIYKEIELQGAPPTWYNCNGSAPITDPFGLIVRYDTLINRATDQSRVV